MAFRDKEEKPNTIIAWRKQLYIPTEVLDTVPASVIKKYYEPFRQAAEIAIAKVFRDNGGETPIEEDAPGRNPGFSIIRTSNPDFARVRLLRGALATHYNGMSGLPYRHNEARRVAGSYSLLLTTMDQLDEGRLLFPVPVDATLRQSMERPRAATPFVGNSRRR